MKMRIRSIGKIFKEEKKMKARVLIASFLILGLAAMLMTPAMGMGVAPGKGKIAKADGNVISVPTDYSTIQAAIDAAQPGAKIMVEPGTYAGAVISKPIEIIGSGDDTVITSGVTVTNPGHQVYGQIFGVNYYIKAGFYIPKGHAADGAKISNFKIDCKDDSEIPFLLGVYAEGADNITVSHMTITNPLWGIGNFGGKGWEITHNTVRGFNQSYVTVAGIVEGIGILINGNSGYDSNPDSVSNNLVAFNTIIAENLSTPPTPRNPYALAVWIGINLDSSSIPDLSPSYIWMWLDAPVEENKVVHNKIVVSGFSNLGPGYIGGIYMVNWRTLPCPWPLFPFCSLYGDPTIVVKNNLIGFNDLRGCAFINPYDPTKTEVAEIVAWPPELITMQVISRNLGTNRAIAINEEGLTKYLASRFKPVIK
jgi:hypothetical protein